MKQLLYFVFSVNPCAHQGTQQWKVKSAMKKITAVLGVGFIAVMIICATLQKVCDQVKTSFDIDFKVNEKDIKDEHTINGWMFLKTPCVKGNNLTDTPYRLDEFRRDVMYNQKHDPEWIIVSGVVINEHSQSGAAVSNISKHALILIWILTSNIFH